MVWVPDPNIALLHPGNNDTDEILSSLEDFDPAKYELPPFDS